MNQSWTVALSWFSGVVVVLGAIGIGLWWIRRVRRKRVWLPTLVLFDKSQTNITLPILRRPPWIPFLAFVVGALTLMSLAFEPQTLTRVPSSSLKHRTHIIFDLSPSVSAQTTMADYLATIESVFAGSEALVGSTTFATTASARHYQVSSVEQVKEHLEQHGFHKPGARLGAILSEQLADLGDVERLIIFSDRDGYSWGDLNWDYFRQNTEVRWVDLTGGNSRANNVYFKRVTRLPYQGSTYQRWQVTLGRVGEMSKISGNLVLMANDKALARQNWFFIAGSKEISLIMDIPVAELARNTEATLNWRVTSDYDDLKLDSDFIADMTSGLANAVLMVPSRFERLLSDDGYQLQQGLEVLGMRTRRLESMPDDPSEYLSSSLWIVMVSETSEESCPVDLGLIAKGQVLAGRHVPEVWLAPIDFQGRLDSLCRCYEALSKAANKLANSPFCQDLTTNERFGETMFALGAKQRGGEVNSRAAMVWVDESTQSGLKLSVFAVPLKPSRRVGLTYGLWPSFIRDQLHQSQLYESGTDQQGRRIERISRLPEWQSDDVTAMTALLNVPLAESFLTDTKATLPSSWEPDVGSLAHTNASEMQRTAKPWLAVAIWLIFAVFAVEILYYGRRSYLRHSARVMVVGLVFGAGSADAYLLVHDTRPDQAYSNLTEVVQSRTSLTFKIAKHPGWAVNQFSEAPWIWSRENLLNQVKMDQVEAWLRRGGMLTLQLDGSGRWPALAKKLVNSGFQATDVKLGDALMRSFYLLRELSACGPKPWQALRLEDRFAVLVIPFDMLDKLLAPDSEMIICGQSVAKDDINRVFINMIMYALTLDYKLNQVHAEHILDRLKRQ